MSKLNITVFILFLFIVWGLDVKYFFNFSSDCIWIFFKDTDFGMIEFVLLIACMISYGKVICISIFLNLNVAWTSHPFLSWTRQYVLEYSFHCRSLHIAFTFIDNCLCYIFLVFVAVKKAFYLFHGFVKI